VHPAPTEWFARRTFHHRRFDPAALVEAKRRAGVSVSVCIPTLNEEATVGDIVRSIRTELMEREQLVDELVVMDSSSSDQTAEEAVRAGATVFQDRDVLPDLDPMTGKGEALWKSLFVLRGDVILWLDADIRNFHPRFVWGPLGPILTDPAIGYVKSFYRRPIEDGRGASLEGGRVTELVARPLINMFWPHLAGLIQPLSGEYAGRRSALESVPFFSGYAVEIGLLIDILEAGGLSAIGQVDLERRIHRNQPLPNLSQMAYVILQGAIRKLEERHRIELLTEVGRGMKVINQERARFNLEVREIGDELRPPIQTIPAYQERRRSLKR
jgi:hypothetical protein